MNAIKTFTAHRHTPETFPSDSCWSCVDAAKAPARAGCVHQRIPSHSLAVDRHRRLGTDPRVAPQALHSGPDRARDLLAVSSNNHPRECASMVRLSGYPGKRNQAPRMISALSDHYPLVDDVCPLYADRV